jgi:hypothetical protein
MRLDESNINGILESPISISSVEYKNHRKIEGGTF